MRIDLHTHTKASDGTFTAKELVLRAKKNRVSALAITDHDTVASIHAALQYGKDQNMEIIPGIELSTRFNNMEVHIVGLFIDWKNEELLKRIRTIQEDRMERNDKMIKRLQTLGYDIHKEELMPLTGGKVLTRAHFAKFLVLKGYFSSMSQVFDKVLGTGCPGYIKRETVSPIEALKLIKKAGGLSILAHPLLYRLNKEELEQLVANLAHQGLDGIETFYSSFSEKDTTYIKTLAIKYNLLSSGGSDFHGDNRKSVDVGIGKGNLKIPYVIIEKMKAKLIDND